MSGAAKHRRRLAAMIWSLACLAVLAAGLLLSDLGQLFAEAAAKVRPEAVLATLPGQAMAMLMYAAALRAFASGVSYWACLGARLLRDAVDNLVVVLPGLGEVICARTLVLAGSRSRAAVTATMVDKIVETVAQVPFILLSGFVLVRHLAKAGGRGAAWSLPATAASLAGLVFIVGLIVFAIALMRADDGPLGRLSVRIREELRLAVVEFREQRRGIPRAFALHLLAWVSEGVQVWMAATVLGLDLGLYGALVMASAAYAARLILFFIPAGLVAQEAGFVAAGLIYGIAAPQALTLSLIMRLRDVVFGLPLLAWPALEYRHGRRARAAH